jgi:AraC-like DNA-binding protein
MYPATAHSPLPPAQSTPPVWQRAKPLRYQRCQLTRNQRKLEHYRFSGFHLVFIETGQGWHWVDNQRMSVEAGDLFLIPPNSLYEPKGLETTQHWIVTFTPDILIAGQVTSEGRIIQPIELLLGMFIRNQGTVVNHLQVSFDDRSLWLMHLRQLETELKNQNCSLTESARKLMVNLLCEVTRLATPHLNQTWFLSHPLLGRVFQYIERNYRRKISLSDVAESVGLSPSYLTDLVRRQTGQTILNWIIEYRMAEARYLLLETKYSIEQIAESVGYLDTSYFIRQFRQVHQITPQAWRNIQ